MPLTPEDVVRTSFSYGRLRGGYDVREVDLFMEEVAAELRRREAEHDELLVELRRPRTTAEVETERVAREREQLDLIKTERQELVSELGGLQSRLTAVREEAAHAETRAREAAVAQNEAESRRDEAQAALTKLQEQVARAQAVYDDLRGATDTVVAELRGLRTEAETRALDLLGREPAEPLGTPADDIDVIAQVARGLHDDHVDAGAAEASRLREEAQSEVEQLRAEAQTEARELVDSARAEQDRMLDEARVQAERLVTEATATQSEATESAQRLLATAELQSREMAESAEAEARRLVDEAEAERAGVLADLQARREVLERRIAELDMQQDEYRERLRALVQQQLASLNDDGWRVGLSGAISLDGNAQR